jgi:hypothetical protein
MHEKKSFFMSYQKIKKRTNSLPMKYSLLLLLSVFVVSISKAQLFDDFTDDEINNNPTWLGETHLFQTSSSTAIPASMRPALQLNSSATTDTASIWTVNNMTIADSLEWSFWVKFSFNPSANNNARIYILSDNDNPEAALNGYFVGVGLNGDDRVSLFRQSGSTIDEIIPGTIATLSNSTNAVRVRVKRDAAANWYLYTDTLGGTNYSLEGTVNDATHNSCNYFSIFCKHTSSNAEKMYFDDIYAGPIIVDTIKPEFLSFSVVSANQIDLNFSEPMKQTELENTMNYSVDGGIGNPSSAVQNASNPTLVHLSFLNSFNFGQSYQLSMSGLTDLSDNLIDSTSFSFAYYIPQSYDIQINEIMADPSPVVGLPDYEYIELYNRTNLPITMENWSFVYGTTEKTMPTTTIPAGGYAILCHQDATASFDTYGITIPLSSMLITNGGQRLSLLDENKAVISTVNFSDSWYQSSYKIDGGWSLEQKDPLNPCGEAENWIASVDLTGGTPGQQNSVSTANPDNESPLLKRIAIVDSMQIQLFFNESMDSLNIMNPANYSLDNGLQIASCKAVFPDYKSVFIRFTQAMTDNTVYQVTVIDSLEDCVGNIITLNSSLRFGISHHPEKGDLVINEILSNPPDGADDFVEIINTSDKILDLKSVVLCTIDTFNGALESINAIAPDGYIIFPGEYHVLTKNPSAIKDNYHCANPNHFVEMSGFPSYNNADGIVVLADMANNIIDMVAYTEEWHHPLLNSFKGVSFERINYARPSDDATNWHSAAEGVGFATPTYQNSQFLMTAADGEISCEPKVFSPDNDGYKDVLNINYNFEKAGYIANILIYDSQGRLIRNLKQNELLGTSGTFTWNGIDENSNKAAIGMYIVFVEVFNLEGQKQVFKKVVTLAGRL